MKRFLLSLLMAACTSVFCGEAKRLNELVHRLASSGKNFTVPNGAWVYVLTKQPTRILDAKGNCMAEKEAFINNKEWIGYLPAGEYSVENLPENEDVLANSIPETYFYAPGVDNMPVLDGMYDWPELGPDLLRSITTLSNGHLDWKSLDIFRKHNRIVLNNFGVLGLERDDYVQILNDYFKNNKIMTDTFYDGASLDEYGLCSSNQAPLVKVTEFVRGLENPKSRPLRVWTYGEGAFDNTPERQAFLKACCNGPNKIMMEIYCATPENEANAQAYIERRFLGFMQSIRKAAPEIVPNVGIVPGSFNQITQITLEHFPNIDFRYFLDMQMHLVATSPECRDLGLIGYWGCNYVDEDLQRWGLALMRHYFIEGNTEMLSKRYGFTYETPFLQNADFRHELDQWDVSPAEGGAIFWGNGASKKFASTSMFRWGDCVDDNAMNRMAVLKKGTSGENKISQTIKGLIPGEEYMLNFATVNYYEMLTDQRRPHGTGIHAELDATQADAEPERLYIDRICSNSSGAGRVNLHRIYFKARAEEASLTITDRDSKGIPGEELGVTFIQVKKCFPGRKN